MKMIWKPSESGSYLSLFFSEDNCLHIVCIVLQVYRRHLWYKKFIGLELCLSPYVLQSSQKNYYSKTTRQSYIQEQDKKYKPTRGMREHFLSINMKEVTSLRKPKWLFGGVDKLITSLYWAGGLCLLSGTKCGIRLKCLLFYLHANKLYKNN